MAFLIDYFLTFLFQLWFDVGGGETMLQYNHTKVDDGKWHRIRATR